MNNNNPSDSDFLVFSDRENFFKISQKYILTIEDINAEIENNFFFKQVKLEIERKLIKERVLQLNSIIAKIINIIEKKYLKKIVSISIGGSYSYRVASVDLDLNIILDGADFFDYCEMSEFSSDINVEKVSIMVFSIHDVLNKKGSENDTIITKDFNHQDLIMREFLVAPIRNIYIYGKKIEHNQFLLKDTLIRIGRQLYYADLVLNEKIKKYSSLTQQKNKTIARIFEAQLLLKWLINQIK